MMSDHLISAPTATASLNGTDITESNSAMNQNKTILAGLLKVTKVVALVIGYLCFVWAFFIYGTYSCSSTCFNVCVFLMHKLQVQEQNFQTMLNLLTKPSFRCQGHLIGCV